MRATLKPLWQRWLARRIPPAASVRLNQRRIFILPSRVGGAFAVALLLMLLVGINYQNSLAYGLTFLLMAVFVVTILHTYRNLAGLVLKAGGGAAVFAAQWGIGVVLDLWPRTAAGGYAPSGYAAAFGLCAVLQVAALAWLALFRARPDR